MIFLGLSQDRYDAGVCLSDGRRILFAANEERYTRHKTQGGFPTRALAHAWRFTGMRPTDVDAVCVAGRRTPPLPLRAWPSLQQWLFADDRTGTTPWRDRAAEWAALALLPDHLPADRPAGVLPTLALRRLLPDLRRAALSFTEHHHAHAAAAWTLSGFHEALSVTCDSMGDGISLTVARCDDGGITRLWAAPARHSLGRFYEIVTEALGFIPSRHEGKVTGLAAHGDRQAVQLGNPFALEAGQLRWHGSPGRAGVRAVQELLHRHRREDICAWAQGVLEDTLLQLTRDWLQRTGLRRLVLGGGVFANVRLNQKLHELPEVDALFVTPNMGDGGNAVGAVAAQGGLERQAVGDVFWGDAPSDAEIRAALDGAGLAHEKPADLDDRIAACLAAGGLVGVVRGRMEWGPRALGHRSILASAREATTTDKLNRQLARSDFMPFAPALPAEDAKHWLVRTTGAESAGRFMTCCFDATAALRQAHPSVVHVDGSVRAQLVGAADNPDLHAILSAVRRRTGSGVVLNTSFNVHEEPIVRTAGEAVATFRRAGLDALALGEYWVGPPRPCIRP